MVRSGYNHCITRRITILICYVLLVSVPLRAEATSPLVDSPLPVPTSIAIAAPRTTLTSLGETVQLTVTATFSGGTTQNVTTPDAGTMYDSSDPGVVIVDSNGLVTAVGKGTA